MTNSFIKLPIRFMGGGHRDRGLSLHLGRLPRFGLCDHLSTAGGGGGDSAAGDGGVIGVGLGLPLKI